MPTECPADPAALGSWIQSGSTQSPEMKVEPSPPYGTVGSSITLSIVGFSKQPQRYTWFRKTTDDPNRIVSYNVLTKQRAPAHGREMVYPNGSLGITNLTLEDDDKYIVEIFALADGPQKYSLSVLSVYLHVYDPSSRGGVTAGIVMGVLMALILLVTLIYFLFIRKTGGTSPEIQGDPGPGERTYLPQKQSQAAKKKNSGVQDSASSTQGLGSLSTSSTKVHEDIYETLDVTRVDVYETIKRKPPTKEGGTRV
ncbi:carcinoembryonic antigen-related cell adhesion molecule 4-like [Monodelphis domestica]|uniref:carcinoembryonic antigen-related cell adhesion molecule 4-like n=1 Tax=Monodelphis domestica TaxID=13616 RepID=UPI0024E23F20|nr:carcinoembryonic antigen-related cell adhesion molecule 4-like [Monodelphis domestica]